MGARESGPVTCHNPEGASPFLIVCEHAANRIPESLGNLGLNSVDCNRHIAWDIGALAVSRRLADRIDATLIHQNYSRLVIDCNRNLAHETLVPTVSDGTEIPGNRHLSRTDLAGRITEIWQPFQDAIAEHLDRKAQLGRSALLIAIHSFTPVMSNRARPWHVGLLFNRDSKMADAFHDLLSDMNRRLVIGMNQPYRILDEEDQTIPVHAETRGIGHVAVEIRQDLISDPGGQQRWSDYLASACNTYLEQLD